MTSPRYAACGAVVRHAAFAAALTSTLGAPGSRGAAALAALVAALAHGAAEKAVLSRPDVVAPLLGMLESADERAVLNALSALSKLNVPEIERAVPAPGGIARIVALIDGDGADGGRARSRAVLGRALAALAHMARSSATARSLLERHGVLPLAIARAEEAHGCGDEALLCAASAAAVAVGGTRSATARARAAFSVFAASLVARLVAAERAAASNGDPDIGERALKPPTEVTKVSASILLVPLHFVRIRLTV